MPTWYAWVPGRGKNSGRGDWVEIEGQPPEGLVCFTKREMMRLKFERMMVERGRYAKLDLIFPGSGGSDEDNRSTDSG